MIINSNTKISRIIKFDKRAIEAIVSISSHFEKLRNPILRKVLAPRVTVADAARIGKCEIEEIFTVFENIGFEIQRGTAQVKERRSPDTSSLLDSIKDARVTILDVRPILESGRDPFEHIMDAFDTLSAGDVLQVINSFEPTPIIKILEEKGVKSLVENRGETILTYFIKPSEALDGQHATSENINMLNEEEMIKLKKRFVANTKEIDVRQLEMPEPMITILTELEKMLEGGALFVLHKKIPQYLLPELEERGFNVNILDKGVGDVQMLIYK